MNHKYLSRVKPHRIPIQRHINPGLEVLVMIIVRDRMQVLGMRPGCLDRDLFQYERQRAVVGGLLLLVLAEALAVVGKDLLVLIAHDLTAQAVHQD